MHWRRWLSSCVVAALLGICIGAVYVTATDGADAPRTGSAALPVPSEPGASSPPTKRAARPASPAGLPSAAQPTREAKRGKVKTKPLKVEPAKGKAKPGKVELEPSGGNAGKVKGK